MTTRSSAIQYARIMLAEASRRRHSPVNRFFYWWLIDNAREARRVAFAMPREVAQPELFA